MSFKINNPGKKKTLKAPLPPQEKVFDVEAEKKLKETEFLFRKYFPELERYKTELLAEEKKEKTTLAFDPIEGKWK